MSTIRSKDLSKRYVVDEINPKIKYLVRKGDEGTNLPLGAYVEAEGEFGALIIPGAEYLSKEEIRDIVAHTRAKGPRLQSEEKQREFQLNVKAAFERRMKRHKLNSITDPAPNYTQPKGKKVF